MDVCTIIAKNYVAHARVLARSLAEHEPDVRFKVLIIDDIEGYVDPAVEPFDVVTIEQLDIDGFARMAVIYNVLELSTAVKPWLLRWMLANDPQGGAVYLDPDMRVYAPLTEMFGAVRDHGLVLNPHNTEPMPRDGRKPNEQDILIAGSYNLGFIGIGSSEFADSMLDWWGVRLERDCIVDPGRGFFVDQRWMDLVPGMAESFHVLRDPGFNVAYWNLATRPVSERDGRWYVKGDVPLRLFHYSGFDAERPHVLSKHQDRIRLGDHPDLARLCAAYADELIDNGVRDVADWPYTYDTSTSGLPLDRLTRRVYRDLMGDGFDASLFEPMGEAAFAAAATAPAPVGGQYGVTHYLATLYDMRGDLRSAFPDLRNPVDAQAFLEWAQTLGRDEVPIPETLLPPRPALVLAGDNGGEPEPEAAPVASAGGRASRCPAAAWGQRRRLPELRARRRRGGPAGHRRARRERGARRCRSGSSPSAAARATGSSTSAPRRTTTPSTSSASTRTCCRRWPPTSAPPSSSTGTRSACGGGRPPCSRSAGTARSSTSTSSGPAPHSSPTRWPRARRSRSSGCRCP